MRHSHPHTHRHVHKRKFIRAVYAAVVALALCLHVYADDVVDDVTAPAPSSSVSPLPINAAVAGRGIISSPGAMNASDIYLFPANSANINGTQIAVGHAGAESGATATYTAVAIPALHFGTVGLYAHGHSRDLLTHKKFTHQTTGLSFAAHSETYAYAVGGHAGFTRRGVNITEEDAPDFSFGFDFRVSPSERISGRAYFINTGGDDGEVFGVIANVYPLGRNSDDRSFVGRTRGGQSHVTNSRVGQSHVTRFWDIDLGAGIQVSDNTLTVGASAQVGFGNMFFARAGYEISQNELDKLSDDLSNLSDGLRVGGGARWRGVGVDGAYAFNPNGGGGVWSVGASYEIVPLKNRTAAQNFALAQERYARGRYGSAITYARRALRGDSTHWNAQAILHKSNIAIERSARERGAELTIIYGTNAGGAVIPFPPSEDALGGLGRYTAAVENLRRRYPTHFAIDANNLIDATSDARRFELASAFYDAAKFDAVAPGPGAFGADENYLFALAQTHADRVVITNLADNRPEQTGISDGIQLTKDGRVIYVINIVAASVLREEDLPRAVINIGGVRSILNGSLAADADLRVAVIYGTLDDVERLLRNFPTIDIVIAPSLEERTVEPIIYEGTMIVSAGGGNRFVGALSLTVEDVVLSDDGSDDDSADAFFDDDSDVDGDVVDVSDDGRDDNQNSVRDDDQDDNQNNVRADEQDDNQSNVRNDDQDDNQSGIRDRIRDDDQNENRRNRPRKKIVAANNRLYPVLQEIAPNDDVDRALGLVRASVVVDEYGAVARSVGGVVAHLTNRGDGIRAFIKADAVKAEYDISGNLPHNRMPIFSSVANRAAFRFGGVDDAALRVVDLANMNGLTIASTRNVADAAFSPADNFLYYIDAPRGSAAGAIYKTRMYMFDALPVLASDGMARSGLSISDDGATILYSARDTNSRWHVYALDSSAAVPPVRLTNADADHRHARMSPDNRYVAYLSNFGNAGAAMNLWIYERGGAHTQITTNANVRDFTWCGESETIYFSNGANMTEFFSVDMRDITTIRRVIPSPNHTSESSPKTWSEYGARFMRDDGGPVLVYTREYVRADNGGNTRRLYRHDIKNGASARLYAVGDYDEWVD